jgi:hypothetical protein
MLSLMPADITPKTRLSRRDVFRLSALSALGLGLPNGLQASSTGFNVDAVRNRASAKRCIYIYLCGGPSQLDMWDPKPEAPIGIRGTFGDIDTKVPGIRLGALLPQVAEHTDKFAIIRSMTIPTTSHDVGIYYTLLASKIAAVRKKAYPAEHHDHPALGAILHKLFGMNATMPPWAIVPRNFTTGDRFYKGQTGGFLGPAYDPLVLNAPKTDSLGRTEFELKNLDFVDKDLNADRFYARRQLLSRIEADKELAPDSSGIRQMQEHYQKAFAMLGSSRVKKAFDVTDEPMTLRERYGMNEYGQSFLLARRLIERDVRLVNVFWTFYGKEGCQFNLWDNHGSDKEVCGGARTGVEMLTHDYCCPSFDRAFSALLDDLNERGLLDETLVVVVGEFGRTPKINKNSGRDHWGSCYSSVLAGGGVQGGQVYGSSDNQAAYVKDSPTSPYDLHATILHAFGLSPETPIPDPANRPVRISDGMPVKALF